VQNQRRKRAIREQRSNVYGRATVYKYKEAELEMFKVARFILGKPQEGERKKKKKNEICSKIPCFFF